MNFSESVLRTQTMQARLVHNLSAAQADDFVDRIGPEVRRRGDTTLPIHVSRDFFDAAKVGRWAAVARRCPRTTCYAYTRSWRVPTIAPALAELAGLRNVRLWFSRDAETEPPSDIPTGVRVAYLQTDRDELPIGDLVFRIRPLRSQSHPRLPLSPVCPTEVALPRTSDLHFPGVHACQAAQLSGLR